MIVEDGVSNSDVLYFGYVDYFSLMVYHGSSNVEACYQVDSIGFVYLGLHIHFHHTTYRYRWVGVGVVLFTEMSMGQDRRG